MEIRKVTSEEDVEKLLNLLQEYEEEFSPITKKTNNDGIFDLDCDLASTDNYLLYIDKEAIGFCVKGFCDNRHDIYEFYIAPQKRGNDLGSDFACKIFSNYKGNWQVHIAKFPRVCNQRFLLGQSNKANF